MTRQRLTQFARALPGALLLALWLPAAPARACSAEDWKACAGKAWVVGEAETPIGERWWPHPVWGANDEAGSTNWYARPEVVMRALAEARSGKVYRLARSAEGAAAAFDEAEFLRRRAAAGAAPGASAVAVNEALPRRGSIVLDGPARLAVALDGARGERTALRYYNGATQAEVEGSGPVRKLGVDKLHPVVARTVLIDVAGAKGVAHLEAGVEITMADVRQALERQGLASFAFLPGDGVFFRTGWGSVAARDAERWRAGAPGIGMEVARWLSDTVQAGVVGSDAWTLEAVPAADAACVFCVQAHLTVRHGIVRLGPLELDALAADKAWRFATLVGAAGASGALALR